ncbi:MAG TPA: hypothetical protein VLK26_08440 [Rudaea sp.]|nr:hypothetical protein [Rudaea sp.]
MKQIFAVWLAGSFLFSAAQAQSLSDAVFNAGFESGIVLQGRAGYPGPLAGAVVELHLGGYVATARTQADGSYRLFAEQRYFSPVTIAELFAIGQGADAALVWASPLGPSDRLLSLASGGTLAFPTEAFLNLNPRTTALAGALRAYNGFTPIADKATFYKAARSYQDYVQDLTYALALVARGDQALPANAANTFAAVASMAPSQQLFADEFGLANVDCTANPTAPLCVVRATLPTDPAILPTYPWNDGRTYLFGMYGFDNNIEQPFVARPHATTADFLINGAFVTLDSAVQGDGSYTLTLSGGATISSEDSYPVIAPYGQVHQHDELIAVHVRNVRGPGGQTEVHGAGDHRVTYPDNSGISQPVYYSDTFGLPRYAGSDTLPPELAADVPTIANHGFVLASPFAVPITAGNGFESPYGYDVYAFGASSGSTERQGKSYTFSVTGPASFSVDFTAETTTVEVQFINEESPGIWLVSVHATGPSSEQFFESLLLETTGAAGGFSGANDVSDNSYAANVNGAYCDGPYATLGALAGDPNGCGPPYFGWIFHSGSATVNRLKNGAPWGEWQLPGGADTGRLLFATPGFSASPITQIRGWELVRSDGANDSWVLENVTVNPDASTNAPPVSFKPTGRLTHVRKQ